MKEKNIKLTENAQKQLEMFKDEQVRKLFDMIVSNKSYPGMEDIEITASDIAQYGKQVYFSSKRQSPMLKMVAWTYLLLGVVGVIYGIFYNELKYIAYHNPEQLISIILGITMIILSIFILLREKRKRIPIDYYQR